MPGLSQKTLLYGAAGAFGGSTAWAIILYISSAAGKGLLTEIMLGGLSGMFIGGFLWSHGAITGRQYKAAIKRAAFGALAGLLGGVGGAGLGNTAFSAVGKFVADLGGLKASLGVALAVAFGWAILGAAVGISGGLIIGSRERTLYGLSGGFIGGFLGGLVFNLISATSIWSALTGLMLLGMFIGVFISLVEEAFVSAKIKVIKGRHVGREFPLLRELNVIGRDDRSDICLSGAEGVGIRHALIKRSNGRYQIEADQQGKVVYVNHKLTHGSRLSDGDVIRVGSVILMFSALRKAAAAALIFIFLGMSAQVPNAGASEVDSIQITQFDLGSFPVVKAYVSLLDAGGKPVPGLGKGSVILEENNHPVMAQGMELSGAEGRREPLSFALVLDRSGSMAGDKLDRAKESVLRFISLMAGGDRASLYAFSDKVERLESLTGDQDDLIKEVRAIQPSGHTALYDAIAHGVESVQGVSGRRAVIVLTDGIANRGIFDISRAIDSAMKAYVSVYVIGLGEDVRTARLERIANETGGSYFFTPSPEGLADIYETISRRIHNEYIISYVTAERGEYLRDVSISVRSGRTATRSYFQPESSLFGSGGRLPGWALGIPLLSIAGLIAISVRSLDPRFTVGHLSLVQGRGTKKEIDINAPITIGRDERNMLGLFKDDMVAQQHAEVTQEEGKYVIVDKGTSAGTYVNQKMISGKQELRDGDIIDIGKTRIVFSASSERVCPGCGSPVGNNAKFCQKCGLKAA
jgi:VWFA-related protein